MNKSRCLVRCKAELQPETLCEVINKTKVLSAQQVVKNERGEEVRRLRGLDKTGSPTNWGKTTSSQSRHVASIQESALHQTGGSWETTTSILSKINVSSCSTYSLISFMTTPHQLPFCSYKVMLSFGAAPASSCGKGNNSSLPDYLPEEDDVVISDKVGWQTFEVILLRISVHFIGDNFRNYNNNYYYHFLGSGFQAIKKVGGDDKENGWLSSVTTFFSKTLYW